MVVNHVNVDKAGHMITGLSGLTQTQLKTSHLDASILSVSHANLMRIRGR